MSYFFKIVLYNFYLCSLRKRSSLPQRKVPFNKALFRCGKSWISQANPQRNQGDDAMAKPKTGLVTPVVECIKHKRTPEQVIAETGRHPYVDDDVVATMPRGKGGSEKLVFFKPPSSAYKRGLLSCAALAKEYKRLGLKPDAEALADYNKQNPAFADATPNACQWVNKAGDYCCATFDRWAGVYRVYVYRSGDVWGDRWSFSGVPE